MVRQIKKKHFLQIIKNEFKDKLHDEPERNGNAAWDAPLAVSHHKSCL